MHPMSRRYPVGSVQSPVRSQVPQPRDWNTTSVARIPTTSVWASLPEPDSSTEVAEPSVDALRSQLQPGDPAGTVTL